MNYGNLPNKYCNLKKSKIAIVPVAYDGTSTWIKGANKGPTALLDASKYLELYDIETDSEVYKNGIFTNTPLKSFKSPREMVGIVNSKINKFIAQDKFIVLIGGEHSVSIGSIYAHANTYPNMSVLQLDAHSDLRDIYRNSKYNHACVMARAKEVCPIVQVGIRSMDSSELPFIDDDKIFYAKDMCNSEKWMKKAINQLSPDVYITIDLDVFDPSIMPSTGTPEPGGLYWYAVLKFLRKVAIKRNIVGFDVVELCPNRNNKAPDFLAAKLIYKLLSYKFLDRN